MLPPFVLISLWKFLEWCNQEKIWKTMCFCNLWYFYHGRNIVVYSLTIPHPIFEIYEIVFPLTLFQYELRHSFTFETQKVDALTSIPWYRRGLIFPLHCSTMNLVIPHHCYLRIWCTYIHALIQKRSLDLCSWFIGKHVANNI